MSPARNCFTFCILTMTCHCVLMALFSLSFFFQEVRREILGDRTPPLLTSRVQQNACDSSSTSLAEKKKSKMEPWCLVGYTEHTSASNHKVRVLGPIVRGNSFCVEFSWRSWKHPRRPSSRRVVSAKVSRSRSFSPRKQCGKTGSTSGEPCT